MNITGTVTANATVNTFEGNKSVVNFSIAVNDSYKDKNGKRQEHTEYFRCAYWLRPNIAQYITKGSVLEINGDLRSEVYTDRQGEARVALNFNVSRIQFHHIPKSEAKEAEAVAAGDDQKDDLPF